MRKDAKETQDGMPTKGTVHVELRGPDGEIKQEYTTENIITAIGNQMIAEQSANISTPPARPTGMRLGTGTTAVATTGAGAALVTYKAGSNATIIAPTSGAGAGTSRRITWGGSWAAGVATDTALAEAVIVNDTIATDATTGAPNTMARVLLSPQINKGAADTLSLTWQWDIGT